VDEDGRKGSTTSSRKLTAVNLLTASRGNSTSFAGTANVRWTWADFHTHSRLRTPHVCPRGTKFIACYSDLTRHPYRRIDRKHLPGTHDCGLTQTPLVGPHGGAGAVFEYRCASNRCTAACSCVSEGHLTAAKGHAATKAAAYNPARNPDDVRCRNRRRSGRRGRGRARRGSGCRGRR
jgi:hypothetical protein